MSNNNNIYNAEEAIELLKKHIDLGQFSSRQVNDCINEIVKDPQVGYNFFKQSLVDYENTYPAMQDQRINTVQSLVLKFAGRISDQFPELGIDLYGLILAYPYEKVVADKAVNALITLAKIRPEKVLGQCNFISAFARQFELAIDALDKILPAAAEHFLSPQVKDPLQALKFYDEYLSEINSGTLSRHKEVISKVEEIANAYDNFPEVAIKARLVLLSAAVREHLPAATIRSVNALVNSEGHYKEILKYIGFSEDKKRGDEEVYILANIGMVLQDKEPELVVKEYRRFLDYLPGSKDEGVGYIGCSLFQIAQSNRKTSPGISIAAYDTAACLISEKSVFGNSDMDENREYICSRIFFLAEKLRGSEKYEDKLASISGHRSVLQHSNPEKSGLNENSFLALVALTEVLPDKKADIYNIIKSSRGVTTGQARWATEKLAELGEPKVDIDYMTGVQRAGGKPDPARISSVQTGRG